LLNICGDTPPRVSSASVRAVSRVLSSRSRALDSDSGGFKLGFESVHGAYIRTREAGREAGRQEGEAEAEAGGPTTAWGPQTAVHPL
jgi:hypothetical protein